MYYIYILYSSVSDKFYVGYSTDPQRRLIEHNTKPFNTYTSKHRPWMLKACFECSKDEKETMSIERFIKKQKSRKLLEMLCDSTFIPNGALALPIVIGMVRVPHVRD
jgi:putative endonuclease